MRMYWASLLLWAFEYECGTGTVSGCQGQAAAKVREIDKNSLVRD